MPPGWADRLLTVVLPDRTPVGYEELPRGNRQRTLQVTFATGPPAVVHYAPDDPTGLLVEGTLGRQVASRTDVPVPAVIASGRYEGGSYLLTERVRGVSLQEAFTGLDPRGRRRVARTLGRSLGTLHERFVFDGFGSLGLETDSLTVIEPTSDWPTAFRSLAENGLTALTGPLATFASRVRIAISNAIDTLPRAPTPRLFPWDFRPGNALVRNGEVVALLDWERPRTAHRELSLAKAEYLLADWYDLAAVGLGTVRPGKASNPDAEPVDRDAIAAAFYAGYGERLPIPAGYWRERRCVYRLCAIVRTAIDSNGEVTRPGYPMVDPEKATRFHRAHLEALL